jgi:hypothetical protein
MLKLGLCTYGNHHDDDDDDEDYDEDDDATQLMCICRSIASNASD